MTGSRASASVTDPCPHGPVTILFDGKPRVKSVPAGTVEVLGGSGQPRS